MVKTLAIRTQLSVFIGSCAVYSWRRSFSACFYWFPFCEVGCERLSLRRDKFRFAGGLQFENGLRQFCVDLNIKILRQMEVALWLKQLLLHRNSAGRVDPQQDARDVISQMGRLGNQLQLLCGNATGSLRSQELDVVRLE